MHVRARAVLNTLSSSIQVSRPISSLSMGQRRTVAIAKTLLNNPDLILLDEPTDSLSIIQTAEVLEYIKRLRAEGRSVVMVCHDLPDVFAIADRIAVLRQGRIIAVHNASETSYEQILAEIAGIPNVDDHEDTDVERPLPHGDCNPRRGLIKRRTEQSGLPA